MLLPYFSDILHKLYENWIFFFFLQKILWTPSKIISRLGKEIDHPESVCYWAYKVIWNFKLNDILLSVDFDEQSFLFLHLPCKFFVTHLFNLGIAFVFIMLNQLNIFVVISLSIIQIVWAQIFHLVLYYSNIFLLKKL